MESFGHTEDEDKKKKGPVKRSFGAGGASAAAVSTIQKQLDDILNGTGPNSFATQQDVVDAQAAAEAAAAAANDALEQAQALVDQAQDVAAAAEEAQDQLEEADTDAEQAVQDTDIDNLETSLTSLQSDLSTTNSNLSALDTALTNEINSTDAEQATQDSRLDALELGSNDVPPHDLGEHSDVNLTSVMIGDTLTYNGTDWVPGSSSSTPQITAWMANEAVLTGDLRIADRNSDGAPRLWQSNSDRTTGGTFNASEEANWTDLGADPTQYFGTRFYDLDNDTGWRTFENTTDDLSSYVDNSIVTNQQADKASSAKEFLVYGGSELGGNISMRTRDDARRFNICAPDTAEANLTYKLPSTTPNVGDVLQVTASLGTTPGIRGNVYQTEWIALAGGGSTKTVVPVNGTTNSVVATNAGTISIPDGDSTLILVGHFVTSNTGSNAPDVVVEFDLNGAATVAAHGSMQGLSFGVAGSADQGDAQAWPFDFNSGNRVPARSAADTPVTLHVVLIITGASGASIDVDISQAALNAGNPSTLDGVIVVEEL